MSKNQKSASNIPNVNINFTESANGVSYSNFALINNSSEEFLFDFGNITPGKEGIEVFSRIALSPRNAKLLYLALGECIRGYEDAFGEIEVEGRREG